MGRSRNGVLLGIRCLCKDSYLFLGEITHSSTSPKLITSLHYNNGSILSKTIFVVAENRPERLILRPTIIEGFQRQ